MSIREQNPEGSGAEAPGSVRLDLFLKQARLIPRRTLAHEVCERGGIKVNGQVAKGSKPVKPGDLIEWTHHRKRTLVRVTRVSRVAPGKQNAGTLYETVKTEMIPEDGSA